MTNEELEILQDFLISYKERFLDYGYESYVDDNTMEPFYSYEKLETMYNNILDFLK